MVERGDAGAGLPADPSTHGYRSAQVVFLGPCPALHTMRAGPPESRNHDEPNAGHSRKAGVWLATLSTVVGVATGMFTLRDQVFPGEAGTAQAVPDSVYRHKVGAICDELNAAERARARELRPLGRRLRRATTTGQQRNALLDAVRHQTARTSHALSALTALEPPKPRAAEHRSTKAAWGRNLDRIRTYAEQLDGASDRREMVAAINYLSRQRSAIARESVRFTAGLQRLGQENCRIAPPISTSALTLPPLGGQAQGDGSTHRETADVGDGGTTGGPSVATPATGEQGAEAPSTGGPSVETPSLRGAPSSDGDENPSASGGGRGSNEDSGADKTTDSTGGAAE